MLVILSFSELIINLLWTLLSLNFLNNTFEIDYLINILIYIILIKIYNLNLLNTITLIFFFNASWVFKLILISLISIFRLSKLHTVTWSWVLLSLFNVNQSVSKWELPTINTRSLIDHFSLKLNNSGLEHLIIIDKNYHMQDSIWGLLRNSSNTTQPSFSHINNLNNLTQTLKTFLLELSHSITILDYNTNVLAFLILIWSYYFWRTIKLKSVIIF